MTETKKIWRSWRGESKKCVILVVWNSESHFGSTDFDDILDIDDCHVVRKVYVLRISNKEPRWAKESPSVRCNGRKCVNRKPRGFWARRLSSDAPTRSVRESRRHLRAEAVGIIGNIMPSRKSCIAIGIRTIPGLKELNWFRVHVVWKRRRRAIVWFCDHSKRISRLLEAILIVLSLDTRSVESASDKVMEWLKFDRRLDWIGSVKSCS